MENLPFPLVQIPFSNILNFDIAKVLINLSKIDRTHSNNNCTNFYLKEEKTLFFEILFVLVARCNNLDSLNGTAIQQRRRNSSIAKLLSGCPLNKEQYEGKF